MRSRLRSIILLVSFTAHVAGMMAIDPVIGARALSLGGSGLMLKDAFCSSNNAALMPFVKKPVISSSIGNHYLLPEIRQITFSSVIPFNHVAYGLYFLSFGNRTFNQYTIGASGAYQFFRNFSFGMGVRYQNIQIHQYGQMSQLEMNLSMYAQINTRLGFSFSGNGLFPVNLEKHDQEQRNHTYRLGWLYQLHAKAGLILEVQKETFFRPSVKTGLQYELGDSFYTCAGFSSMQPQYTFGIGFRRKHYQLVIATSIAPIPGISNNITILYAFRRS